MSEPKTADLSDLLRAAPRDEGVWLRFFQHFYPAVFYTAYKLTRGDTPLAQDVAQDVFLRFLKYDGLNRVDSDATTLAYLRQMARNLVFTHRRRSAKWVSLDEHAIEALAEADEPSTDEWLRPDLERLLQALSEEDREIVALTLEGYSIREIAMRLQISYSAAAVRLHRARQRLAANAKSESGV
jgi:RNA polymerase sigma-70 factor, ECF subfamily